MSGTGPQSVSGWATNLSAGPANEAAQTLQFLVSTTSQTLFAVQPAVSPDGTLTFTPAAAGCGIANVTVSLRDSGGTANGGLDTSTPPQTFSINLNCNPIATADSYQVLEDAGPTTLTVLANDSDSDGQVVRITSVTSPAHGTVAIATDGQSVSYKPAADFFGADTFTYTMLDNRGGSATGTVTVNVTGVNDRPSFTKGADQLPTSGTGAQSVSG